MGLRYSIPPLFHPVRGNRPPPPLCTPVHPPNDPPNYPENEQVRPIKHSHSSAIQSTPWTDGEERSRTLVGNVCYFMVSLGGKSLYTEVVMESTLNLMRNVCFHFKCYTRCP